MNKYSQKQKNKIFYGNIFTTEMIAYYQQNIISFVEDIIFQNKTEYKLSDQQKDLLIAIQDNKRVAAKSGKGIGKTSSISFAIIWFLCCFDNPKIICTAPSYPTLTSALWPEIGQWLNKSLVKDIFTQTEEKLYLNEQPMQWTCTPRTAKEKENLQGLHAPNLFIIIDEASGLKLDIFEALDTTLTSVGSEFRSATQKIVMIGNPTQVSGPFFEAFNKFKNKWINKTYSAIDSPFVDRDQIEYYETRYSKHHDLYRVNILGEFPSGSPDAFIKLSDIHAAIQRNSDLVGTGEIEIGVDVARFGDDSTILFWRHGLKVMPCKSLSKSSIPEVVELVTSTVKEIRRKTGYDKSIKVKVDDGGIGGAVTDFLKLDRENHIEVIPCNFGGAGNKTYQNEASTMWGRLRDQINVIGLPDDAHLIEELSSRRWRMSPSGKIMIEPKSEYKKDFKSSPDRADALVLCFANKTNERAVIKTFDPMDSNIVKPKLSYIGEQRIASVFYSKDLYTSLLYTGWDGNKLYIYDEYTGDDPLIYVALNILNHQPLKKVIGNDYMFSNDRDCLANKFRKHNVKLTENYLYNELSAIDTISSLFNMKRIVILDNCKQTIEQLQDWKMDTSKMDQERSYGLCFALCYIAASLKKEIKDNTVFNSFTPYNSSFNKQNTQIPSNTKSSWMSNLLNS